MAGDYNDRQLGGPRLQQSTMSRSTIMTVDNFNDMVATTNGNAMAMTLDANFATMLCIKEE
jgi:hypothetical protein